MLAIRCCVRKLGLKKVIKQYEADNCFLGECSRILQHNVTYEVLLDPWTPGPLPLVAQTLGQPASQNPAYQQAPRIHHRGNALVIQ